MPVGGKRSRNKGSGFERRIAGHLTTWVGTKFSRVPMSGGWAKTGDVTPKDPKEMVRWPFNIECKATEVWDMGMLFKSDPTKLPGCFGKWWKQCTDDAKKSKKIPVVVFTKNHHPEYCIMRSELFRKLGLVERSGVYIRIGKYRVFLWKDLLEIPYGQVLELIEA